MAVHLDDEMFRPVENVQVAYGIRASPTPSDPKHDKHGAYLNGTYAKKGYVGKVNHAQILSLDTSQRMQFIQLKLKKKKTI